MPSEELTITRIPVPIPFRPGTVNAFRVELGGGEWMLVDGGPDTADAWKALDDGVRQAGGWDGLRLHFVTHMHIDHVGLAPRVELQARCPLVMGGLDAERMIRAHTDPEAETAYRSTLYREAGVPGEMQQLAERAAASGRDLSAYREPTIRLPHDGRALADAPDWTTVWTPGHTAGHTALFRAADGALIAGDAVLASISATIGINRQRDDTVADCLDGFRRLQSLAVRTIYPGHGEAFTDAGRIRELADEVRAESDRVRALLNAEPHTAWEIAERRYGERDLPLPARVQALRETFAHLVHLARQDYAESALHADGRRTFSARPRDQSPADRKLIHTVALTGNIAAGKSTVARLWQEQGIPVIEADRLARDAVAPGTDGLQRIVERWGEGILNPDGSLNRPALRSIVFASDEERQALEAIVHPAVEGLRREAIVEAGSRGARLVVADIPLLFEVGLEGDFDAVVLVDAPEQTRLDRLVRDRGLELDTARAMIAAQLPAEEKRTRADYVIENGGSVQELERQALDILARLRRDAEKENA